MKSKVFQEALKMKDEALTIIKNVDATTKDNHFLIDLACEKIKTAETIIREYRGYVNELYKVMPRDSEERQEAIVETRRTEDLLEWLDILGTFLKQLFRLYN